MKIRPMVLTFPEIYSSYSNLAMLMEDVKFSDEMGPQQMCENPQFHRGRTLSYLVDGIFSPFRILSIMHLRRALRVRIQVLV